MTKKNEFNRLTDKQIKTINDLDEGSRFSPLEARKLLGLSVSEAEKLLDQDQESTKNEFNKKTRPLTKKQKGILAVAAMTKKNVKDIEEGFRQLDGGQGLSFKQVKERLEQRRKLKP
jgi:hypothetical protein